MTGVPTAKVIHDFGRADKVDREALSRLVSSISRFLTPEQAASAAGGGEVEVLDSRRLGAAWTLDRLWERLEIGAAIRKVAEGRRLDGEQVERVVFSLGRPTLFGVGFEAGRDRLGRRTGRYRELCGVH